MSESQLQNQPLTLLALDPPQEETSPRPYLSVILPVCNEAAIIAQLLTNLYAELTELLPEQFEILIIDDGSTDETAAQVKALFKQLGKTDDDPEIQLIQRPYNIGNGAAIKAGIRHANGDYLLMMDADGQHQPADISRLLEQAERFDMVVGARTRASQTEFHRDVANTIYNLFATYICDLSISS